MKPHFIPAGAALVLALILTGCETDGGLSARAQEKSATYTSLKPWEKKYIDKGAIAAGFTADMVYIAMGRPDKVETKDLPEGKAELWIYSRFYPSIDAVHGFKHQEFTTESAYQPQRSTTGRGGVPVGMDMGTGSSISATGGPQGGSMEPADLRSYTIKVLFAGDKVAKIGAAMNDN